MFKDLKIRTKLNLVFIVVFIFSMAIIGLVMQIISSRMLSVQIFSQLESTALSRMNHMDEFLKEQVEKIKIAATHGDFTNEELQEIRDLQEDFYEVFVLDSEGIIIASSDESKIGLDRSDDNYFIGGIEGAYIKDAYFSENTQKEAIAISVPFYEGVLVARIETTTLNEITLDRTGLGKTGEIYLVNKGGYMITPSRFSEDTFLKQKVETIGTKYCFEQHSMEEHSNTLIYPDYRGVSVLGSHIYFEKMDWCLLAEIDEKEAMAPTLRILWVYLIVAGIFIILYLVLINWIAKIITKPIITLREGAEIIEKGNLGHKVGTDAKDEIGVLSRAFDDMTKAIKQSRADVDKKVQEQTKDIVAKQKTLEDQQKAILNILEDVEEEKELTKKEKDKIDIVLHSIGDGVFVVDKNMKITMINQVALDLCQCSDIQRIGIPYGKVLKFVYEKTDKINDKFIVDALKTGQIQEMTNHTFLVRRDGTKIPVSDSAAPFKDKNGNIIGCVVVFRDVSKEREIDRMKTEFVSIASHQLRTPLTSISWFTEMLLEGDAGKINKKQEDYLRQVYNSNKRMIKLVNDLLNVSRIETGKMAVDPKPTQIEDLIQGVINETQALTKMDNIEVLFKNPEKKLAKIKLDPTLIRQVIQNLISNGIRYNKKKGKVKIKVEKIDKDLLITVADTGIGIPSKDQKKMFSKFFRADNAVKRQADGNGLGLYVNKFIIETAGGKIWFESEEGKGTIFYITIPISGMEAQKGSRSLIN